MNQNDHEVFELYRKVLTFLYFFKTKNYNFNIKCCFFVISFVMTITVLNKIDLILLFSMCFCLSELPETE